MIIPHEELARKVPASNWLLAVIEQKKVFTLCLNELKTDSTRLLFPKPIMLVKAF